MMDGISWRDPCHLGRWVGVPNPSRALWAAAEAVGRERVMSKAFEIPAGVPVSDVCPLRE